MGCLRGEGRRVALGGTTENNGAQIRSYCGRAGSKEGQTGNERGTPEGSYNLTKLDLVCGYYCWIICIILVPLLS